MKKTFGILVTVMAIISGLLCQSAIAADKVIKIAHNQAETHPVQLGLLKFKQIVEEKTQNAVEVHLYPNGQLADDATGIDQVKLGTIQAAVIMGSIGTFSDAGTAYGNIEELPFMFSDTASARKAWDGKLGELMTKRAESQGLKVMNYWENGFRNFTNNVRPIVVPKDMSGIKFRVASSEIRTRTFNELGASAITIAFSELFTALQQGTVDGQENPLSIIQTSQFYEVQKYLSLSRHIYNTATFIMNQRFWNELTDEQKGIITAAAEEAKLLCRAEQDKFEASVLKTLEDDGMVVNEINTQEFVDAVQPVWDYFIKTYGDDAKALVDAARNP